MNTMKRALRKTWAISAAVALMAPLSAHAYQEVNTLNQQAAAGVEASVIHVIACNGAGENGGQYYVYQYVNRAGFRAILPPNWGQALGGHDWSSFAEAAQAACGTATTGAGAPGWHLVARNVTFPQSGQPAGWDWSSRRTATVQECAAICPIYRSNYGCKSFFYSPPQGQSEGQCNLFNFDRASGLRVVPGSPGMNFDYYEVD